MIPIHQLLNRILWDETFSKADFEIGYYDRVEDKIIHVPFSELTLDKETHFSADITDNLGKVHMVPLHRIKEVYRNGELIWHREK